MSHGKYSRGVLAKGGSIYFVHYDDDYYYLVLGSEETSKLKDADANAILAMIAMGADGETLGEAMMKIWCRVMKHECPI